MVCSDLIDFEGCLKMSDSRRVNPEVKVDEAKDDGREWQVLLQECIDLLDHPKYKHYPWTIPVFTPRNVMILLLGLLLPNAGLIARSKFITGESLADTFSLSTIFQQILIVAPINLLVIWSFVHFNLIQSTPSVSLIPDNERQKIKDIESRANINNIMHMKIDDLSFALKNRLAMSVFHSMSNESNTYPRAMRFGFFSNRPGVIGDNQPQVYGSGKDLFGIIEAYVNGYRLK